MSTLLEHLPSGATSAQLLQLDKAPEGGLLTWASGFKYPLRGYLHPDALEGANMLKKYVRALISTHGILSLYFRRKKILYEIADFSNLVFKRKMQMIYGQWSVVELPDYMYEDSKLHHFKKEFHVPAVGELKRALGRYTGEVGTRLVRGFCTTLENDRPYRMRVVDALSIPLEWAIKPLRSYWKAITALMERDKARQWGKIRLLGAFLLCIPSIRREVKEIAKILDFSKFKFSKDELYFLLKSKEYDIMGLPLEERTQLWEQINKEPVGIKPIEGKPNEA